MGRAALIAGGLIMATLGGAAGAAGVLLWPRQVPTPELAPVAGPGDAAFGALADRVARLETRASQLPPLAAGAAPAGTNPTATAPHVPSTGLAVGHPTSAGTDGTTPTDGPTTTEAPGAPAAVSQLAQTLDTLRAIRAALGIPEPTPAPK